jgi:transcriptional regulator of acetoin/glycerol metabolism
MPIEFLDCKDKSEPYVLRIFDSSNHIRPWEELEREVIYHALITSGGKVGEAADKLGIARSTLYRRFRQNDPAF